jgi:hypothetical protein
VKIAFALVALVVAGCAAPQNAANGPPGSSPDLADDGTGGNGGDDLAMGNGGGGGGGGGTGGVGGGGGGGSTQDLAMPADLATPADLAMPAAQDLAMPACTPVLNVPTSTCGIWPQCGCAGTTPNCNVEDDTTGRAACAAVGTVPDWNSCTGNGDTECGVGRSCVDGVCSPFCGAVSDCPGSYRDCFQVGNSAGTDITGMKVCSSFCDPTNPQSATGGHMACGPNVNCYPGSDHVPYCLGPTTAAGTQGKSCATSNASDPTKCAPGYACVGLGLNLFQCQKFCGVGVANSCPSSYTCSSFATKVYAGTQEIGGCS